MLRGLVVAASLPLLASCFTLTVEPRALVLQPDGAIRALSLSCPPNLRVAQAAGLDPHAIRVATWNIHKEGDAGWADDLVALGARNDVVLLQETALTEALQEVLRGAALHWVMASSFAYGSDDIGVLTAARVPPVATCTQRVVEPLLRLPKSAVITWFALEGSPRTLAVANVHAINFSLSIDAYREQLAALGDVLAAHDGPIVLAGDLNTWSSARKEAVGDVTRRLGMSEVAFADDRRALFFGNQLDHIFVRGLRVLASTAIVVTSSDHNPVAATLQTIEQ